MLGLSRAVPDEAEAANCFGVSEEMNDHQYQKHNRHHKRRCKPQNKDDVKNTIKRQGGPVSLEPDDG